MNQKEHPFQGQYRDWLTLRNYSPKTIKCYTNSIRKFWQFCEKRQEEPDFEKADAVRIYLLYRYREQQVSWQTVNGDYSALRLFYKNILEREWNLKKLPRPRKQKSLPKVITPEQVSLLIEKAAIFKHKVFITLLYSTGLRLGEALRLRVEDIEASAMRIRVNDGKGAKDRYTLLSLDLLDMLRFYFRAIRPEGGWVFNGKYKGERTIPQDEGLGDLQVSEPQSGWDGLQWSQKAAQHAIVEARRAAKLPEFVTAHTLRHCFATHLLQNGTDLVTIQKLMGNKYLKTTVRYIHLDNEHFIKITNPSERIEAWEKLIKSVKSSAAGVMPTSPSIRAALPYAEPLKTSNNAAHSNSADYASNAGNAAASTKCTPLVVTEIAPSAQP